MFKSFIIKHTNKRKSDNVSMIKFIFKTLILFTLISILALSGLYLYSYFSPKIQIKSSNKFYLYDNNNDLIYKGSGSNSWVDINNINPNLKNAILSIEDKNFYKHKGFDYPRIISAIIKNIKHKKVVEGASTISQQYVKNLYLSFDKTWKRKVEEALLTSRIELQYSKDDILEGYLNTINFGQGNYGIDSAASFYFNKKPSELSVEESCILASIPKSPTYFNPLSYYDNSIKRAKIVAKKMYENNYITRTQYNNLFKKKIRIIGKRKSNNLTSIMYYQDAVLDELSKIKQIPDSLAKSGGLKIYSSLDMKTQESLEKAINNNMKNDNTEVAAVYINPTTGEIEALAGGKDYNLSQYNRVLKSKRQVGSTIKPFLYYTALENGLTMASTFKSEKTTFNLDNDKVYSPQNYNDLYANKKITMAAALAYSDNVYAVKTHLFLGEDALINTLKNAGLQENVDYNPSLALGAKEINLLDYASCYTTLASGGIKKDTYFIRKVEDLEGNILYKKDNREEQVLNYDNVYIVNEMMKNTYNKDFIDYNSPTAISIAGRLTKDYAIKTGTTNYDHWVIGYNRNGLLLVWTGQDKNEKKTDGYSSITKNIWADTMEESQRKLENSWYEKPNNIIAVPLNPITGSYDAKKRSLFFFVKGTEPIYENQKK